MSVHTDITMEVELLKAINQKLSILDILRKDIGEIRTDLEVTQSQINQIRMDNRTLKGMLFVSPEKRLFCRRTVSQYDFKWLKPSNTAVPVVHL